MNKSDLKDGMIVELRNGEELHILHDLLLRKDANMYIGVSSLYGYDRDLLMLNKCSEEDIIKVFDAQNNLVWERKEVDWSKVPFGTKVICWNTYNGKDSKRFEGRFIKYDQLNTGCLVYVKGITDILWGNCELAENSQKDNEILLEEVIKGYDKFCGNKVCDDCKYKGLYDCEYRWLFNNYNVTRKVQNENN